MLVVNILVIIGDDLRAEHALHLKSDRTLADPLNLVAMDGLQLNDFSFKPSVLNDLYDLLRKLFVREDGSRRFTNEVYNDFRHARDGRG